MSSNARVKREAKKYAECEHKPSNVIQYEQNKNKLQPLNESQRQFISALFHDEFVIGAGKAGTGKTYLAARVAAQLYKQSKNIKYLILTRPNIEAGEKLGYLPGELEEKYEPYLKPFKKGLIDELGPKFNADLYRKIIPYPLGYMRGETYDDAIMLLDEAQNTTIEQMKMFVTRVGTNSRIFITGDDTGQCDLKTKENGLQWLIRQIRTQNLPYEIVNFRTDDIVRAPLCKNMMIMIDRAI